MKILLLLLNFYFYLYACDAHKSQRIIGGELATAAQYPFLAAIYKKTSDGTYFCGGSLISQRWILTAGQCVNEATLFTIYLGTNNIKTPSSTSVKLATEEYFLHPDFNPLTLENDIGLIKLRMNVTLTDYIKAVTLPWHDVSENFLMRAIGWGQTSDDDAALSDDLTWVPVTTITNQECKVTYSNQVTDNMICVVGNYNQGTCYGDTGSPIIWFYVGTIPVHQGVASFVSTNGCESTDPSGFTRSFPYVKWISNVTNNY